ncbi:MAG: hypothetical protein ABSH53_12925 [Holophaga sp.]|jgi:hypothetical protein
MLTAKWFIPIALAGTSLAAQSNDINGLMNAASHYVSSGMATSRDPESLGLYKIHGGVHTPQGDVLMTKAADVQHWTFLYKINGPGPDDIAMPPLDDQGQNPDPSDVFGPVPLPGPVQVPAPAPPAPRKHVSVTAECTHGVFNNFRYSDKAVKGLKTLDFTWIAASLDTAIGSLNASGYVQGFTSVGILRPDLPSWPDELVYVFNCPFERRQVAISCQTGELAWTYGY